MITLRKAADRRHAVHGGQESWSEPEAFRSLESFREEGLRPGAEFRIQAPRDLEVVTYVSNGAVVLQEARKRTAPLETGECRRSTVRKGELHRAVNGSLTDPAQLFQCFLLPDDRQPQAPPERKRFSMAERRGVLKLLASRDGRDSSLRLRQDADVYSSILQSGHHLIHELAGGRGAWLHVVRGRIRLVEHLLGSGDGAWLVKEVAVSLTAMEPSEILLVDLV